MRFRPVFVFIDNTAGAQLYTEVYTEDGNIATGEYSCASPYLSIQQFGPNTFKGTEFSLADYSYTGGSILYTFDGATYSAPWLLSDDLKFNFINYGDFGFAVFCSMEMKIDKNTYQFSGAFTPASE